MTKALAIVTLLVVMIALIVGCDVLFLRGHFGIRLAVNMGIVAVFGAIYVIFVRRA